MQCHTTVSERAEHNDVMLIDAKTKALGGAHPHALPSPAAQTALTCWVRDAIALLEVWPCAQVVEHLGPSKGRGSCASSCLFISPASQMAA